MDRILEKDSMARENSASSTSSSTANICFEARLWLAADELGNNMDAAEPVGAKPTAQQGGPNPPFNDSDGFQNWTAHA